MEFEVVPVSVSPVLSPMAPSEEFISVSVKTSKVHHQKSSPKEILLPRVPTPEIPIIITNNTEDLPKLDVDPEPELALASKETLEENIEPPEENNIKITSQGENNLILDKTKILEAKNVKAFGEAKPIFSTKFRTLKIDKFWKKKKSKKSNSSSVSTSHSPEGFSSSSAAALGSGASSSTSSRSGVVPEDLEEQPYDNRYYPCLGNDCEAATDYDAFSQDYR